MNASRIHSLPMVLAGLLLAAATLSAQYESAEVLETDTSDRGQVIGSQPIVELPLNGRNFSDLALPARQIQFALKLMF